MVARSVPLMSPHGGQQHSMNMELAIPEEINESKSIIHNISQEHIYFPDESEQMIGPINDDSMVTSLKNKSVEGYTPKNSTKFSKKRS